MVKKVKNNKNEEYWGIYDNDTHKLITVVFISSDDKEDLVNFKLVGKIDADWHKMPREARQRHPGIAGFV
ncbi:MAG: hypothetical protein LBK29_01845 [Oscillospiraceae bacterium]|jgi:hypothetical protein|nr:hypothetical protein [Oscillospiraceae bacterium]